MTAADLRAFEAEIAALYEAGKIPGPTHLSGGNEAPLLEIFQNVQPEDWVLSTWRSHYHALLHGVPPAALRQEILAGRSMNLHFPAHNFLTSAIVGGILPIACGLGAAGHKVWCFIGDMTATTGHFADAARFVAANNLPVRFIVEDNGLSTNSPTKVAWARGQEPALGDPPVQYYSYQRIYPHYGSKKYVPF